jgi:CBS domain-containing protein
VDVMLAAVGEKKRDHVVRERLTSALTEAGLLTEPDWELADREEAIVVRPAVEEPPEPEPVDEQTEPDPAPDAESEIFPEFAPTIRVLLDGRAAPTTVAPTTSLSAAIELMMLTKVDYLPVVDDTGLLMGAVSWKTYAAMHVANNDKTLANAMDRNPPTIQDGKDLLEAVSVIADHGYVLVRDQYGRLCGLVTITDLASRYRDLLAPFQKIGEIERRLRRCTNARLATTDFSDAWGSKKTKAEDLTFGQYKRLLEEPARWAKFGLGITSASFCKLLDDVREIRNRLAHFNTEDLDDSKLLEVDRLLGLLRSLDPH